MKRFLSMLLAALMLISVLPFAVLADEPAAEPEGPGKELLPAIDGLTEELEKKLEEDKSLPAEGEEGYPWGGLNDEAFKEYIFAQENAEYLTKLIKKTGGAENKAFRARIRLIEKNADRKAVQDYLESLVSGEEAADKEELSDGERELLARSVKKYVQAEDEESDPARDRASALADEFAGEASKELADANEGEDRALDASALAALMAEIGNVRGEMRAKGVQSKTIASLPENGKALADSDLYDYGYCGPDVMWGFSLDGILVVTGNGRMYDYDTGSYKAPWVKYIDYICAIGVAGTVTNIGDYAFCDCEEVYIVLIEEGVKSIGMLSFEGLFDLPEIEIPASVTSIGLGAFAFNISLTSVTVASGNAYYKSQGNCVIEKSTNELVFGCKASVIPSGVKSIGHSAFAGCRFTSCTIPDGVTSIDDMAFYGAAITSVTIPGSVTSIGDMAFKSCDYLRDVYFKGTQAKWNSIYFGSENTNLLSAQLHCEAAPTTQVSVSLSKTKATITWKAVTGATGYKLYMRLDNESTPSKMVTIAKAKTVKYAYSGLVPGHTYHFSVAPVISGTTGTRSAEVSVTVYLDTPKLKAKRVGGSMSLSWSAVKGASGYELTVTDSKGNTDTYKYAGSVKKATIQGKRSGRHTITLTAYTSSATSKTATASLDVALDTPKLKAKAKNNVITASWSAVKGIAGYKLMITDSAGNTNIQTLGPSVKKATFTVAPSGTYTILLYAFSGEMTSNVAAVRGSVTMTGTTLKAKAAKGTVTLSWKQVKTADQYEIYRAEGSSTSFRRIATVTGSAKNYVDRTVIVGQTYTYRIRPVGNGPYAYGKGPVYGAYTASVRVVAK